MANGFGGLLQQFVQQPTGAQRAGQGLAGFNELLAQQELQKRASEQQLNQQIKLAQAQSKIAIEQAKAKSDISSKDPFMQLINQAKAAEAAKTLGNEQLFNQIQAFQPGQQTLQQPAQQPTVSTQTPSIGGLGSIPQAEEPKPGDLIPGGFKKTPFGKFEPTTLERVKKTSAQEKREVEISELEAQIGNLITSFRDARQEAGGVPGIGSLGPIGRAAGLTAVGIGKIGLSPKVNVFEDRIKAFATTVAKAAGEVRPTDTDIERFIGTLPTVKKNDEENEIIIQGLINDLRARGAKALWQERGKDSNSQQKMKRAKEIRKQNPNMSKEEIIRRVNRGE